MIEGTLVVSSDLKIIHGNLAVEEMFGHSRDFFEGGPLTELFLDQDANGPVASALRPGGKTFAGSKTIFVVC